LTGQISRDDEAPAPLRVAFVGAATPLDRALVQEAGGDVVDDASAADAVHVTLHAAAAADAVERLVEERRSVVLHGLPILAPEVATRLAVRAADAGVVVAVPFVHRYYPMVRLARRRVRSGSPGPLHLLHGWALRESVAAWCDLVEFVTRHRIERVVTAEVAASRIETTDGAPETPGARGLLFTTDHDSVGTLAVSDTRPIEGGTLLVALDGVDEKVVFHEGRPEVLDVIGSRSSQRFQRAVGADVSRYSTLPAGRPQGHRDTWAAYVGDAYAAIRGGAPDGLPTLSDLARTASLLAAIRESEANSAWARVGADAAPDLITTTEGKTA
jgi:predicted dehydrogenase